MLDDIVEILERVRDTARVTGNLAEAQRVEGLIDYVSGRIEGCLLYTSPSPRD